jgi:hypothetical protein
MKWLREKPVDLGSLKNDANVRRTEETVYTTFPRLLERKAAQLKGELCSKVQAPPYSAMITLRPPT